MSSITKRSSFFAEDEHNFTSNFQTIGLDAIVTPKPVVASIDGFVYHIVKRNKNDLGIRFVDGHTPSLMCPFVDTGAQPETRQASFDFTPSLEILRDSKKTCLMHGQPFVRVRELLKGQPFCAISLVICGLKEVPGLAGVCRINPQTSHSFDRWRG